MIVMYTVFIFFPIYFFLKCISIYFFIKLPYLNFLPEHRRILHLYLGLITPILLEIVYAPSCVHGLQIV